MPKSGVSETERMEINFLERDKNDQRISNKEIYNIVAVSRGVEMKRKKAKEGEETIVLRRGHTGKTLRIASYFYFEDGPCLNTCRLEFN